MIVDAHTHIFPPEIAANRERFRLQDAWFARLYASPKARLSTAEDLVAAMDEAQVDVAVVCGFGWADAGLCRLHNDYIASAVQAHRGRLVGLAVVNPRTSAAPAELARAASLGLAGIGELMPDGQGYSLADADTLAPIAEAAGALGWPVLTHACEPVGHDYAGKGAPSLAAALSLAQAFPSLTLILAHWGGGLLFYELMPEVRRALARVYYDTAASPLLYDDRIYRLGDDLAPGRVLYASDWPLLPMARCLAQVRAAGLSPSALASVLGKNAAVAFGLGGVAREADT